MNVKFKDDKSKANGLLELIRHTERLIKDYPNDSALKSSLNMLKTEYAELTKTDLEKMQDIVDRLQKEVSDLRTELLIERSKKYLFDLPLPPLVTYNDNTGFQRYTTGGLRL